MPFATSDGAKIHYEITGEGPETLLLVMGLGGHATEWGTVFPELLAKQLRVVRMDNRGIGQSETLRDEWTMVDMANDALAVLDAIGVERAHVLGTSMGGMVAQMIALEHPERVARLTLMATSFGGAESVPPADVALALFAPTELSLADQRRRALSVITSPGFAGREAKLIEQLVETRLRVPTRGRVFNMQFKAILESDRAQRVSQIRHQTLIVHGTDDTLVPVGNGKLLAERIPNSRLVLLEHCGHLPHLEMPERCASLVLEFLRESA